MNSSQSLPGSRKPPIALASEGRKRRARERLSLYALDGLGGRCSVAAYPGRTRRLAGSGAGGRRHSVGGGGVYLITQARELGASRWLQGKMIGNLVLDAAVGAVPLAVMCSTSTFARIDAI